MVIVSNTFTVTIGRNIARSIAAMTHFLLATDNELL